LFVQPTLHSWPCVNGDHAAIPFDANIPINVRQWPRVLLVLLARLVAMEWQGLKARLAVTECLVRQAVMDAMVLLDLLVLPAQMALLVLRVWPVLLVLPALPALPVLPVLSVLSVLPVLQLSDYLC
jgi:hypothetical protein